MARRDLIEHFSCIALDLPGAGKSDKPPGPYSTEAYGDQLAGFLGAIGVERAHVAGVSLGAAAAIQLAARHPDRVRSLSLHSAWHRTDAYLRTVVELWRAVAGARHVRCPRPRHLDAVRRAAHGRDRRQ